MSYRDITTPFAKSTYSSGGDQNDCVEVAHTADGGRAVRDSKRPDDGTHHFPPAAWSAFLTTVKANGFGPEA
jgi:hypothetical protein